MHVCRQAGSMGQVEACRQRSGEGVDGGRAGRACLVSAFLDGLVGPGRWHRWWCVAARIGTSVVARANAAPKVYPRRMGQVKEVCRSVSPTAAEVVRRRGQATCVA